MPETILIVDDEDPVRKTFGEWLAGADLGCEVLSAADAETALTLANNNSIDLAILDWNLGAGNNGLQLLEDLSLFHPDVVAIMITGYAHQATPLDAMRMGVRDYLDKSHDLDRDIFLGAVRKQLERIRPAKRERQLQRALGQFRDVVAQILPLVRTAAALNDPVPLTDSIRHLLRFMQRLCAAANGVLVVRSIDSAGSEVDYRAYDMDGNALAGPLLPFAQSMASAVASMQEVAVIADLSQAPKKHGVQLQPFEKDHRSLLAVPLPVAPGMTVVLELFDKAMSGFSDDDRRLVASAARFGGEMLKQAMAERQTHGMLFAAVEAALKASEQAMAATQAAPDATALPTPVKDRLRESMATSSAGPVDSDQTLRLAELVRAISVRHGREATEHCIRLLEQVDRLLLAVGGTGGGAKLMPIGVPASDSPDLFDELFRLLTPERLFRDPRATGDGVRIAVIDTGVERDSLEAKYRAQGIEINLIEGGIFTPTGATPLRYEGHQSTPHGTTVADIILTIAPKAKLYSADVFGPFGSCEVETVIKAIYWAMDKWQCKIINLSLGVPEHRLQQLPRRQQLQRAIEECYYRDVLLFAAAHNEHPITKSYPAIFGPQLISVDKRVFENPLEFAYDLRHQIEFKAHSRGYLGPFIDEPATSWATPHLAGIAARILSLRPEMKPFEIKTVLYWLSRHFQK